MLNKYTLMHEAGKHFGKQLDKGNRRNVKYLKEASQYHIGIHLSSIHPYLDTYECTSLCKRPSQKYGINPQLQIIICPLQRWKDSSSHTFSGTREHTSTQISGVWPPAVTAPRYSIMIYININKSI